MKFFTIDNKSCELEVRKYSLKELYQMVGEPIELAILCLKPLIAVLVNEDGLLTDLPVNREFMEYIKSKFNKKLSWLGQSIVGNVILFKNREEIEIVMN
jgi:hypothetical protein